MAPGQFSVPVVRPPSLKRLLSQRPRLGPEDLPLNVLGFPKYEA